MQRVSAIRSTLRPLTARRHASSAAAAPSAAVSIPALNSIEASWKGLSAQEQEATFQHLADLQKKDWKELSVDEKRAAYYISYGPHGPREPILPPGSGPKIWMGVGAGVGAAAVVFYISRAMAGEKPKTMSKEWEEASNEMAKEQNMDPITGISSEGYKGKGFVH